MPEEEPTVTETPAEEEKTHDSKGRPFITRAALGKHNSRDDVWMTIHNKVYNVSKYLEDHPGGEEVLMDRAGADATEDFEDVGHSAEARRKLGEYEIGELPESERKSADSEKDASSGGGGGMVAAVAVLVIAVGAGYYYMNFMQ